MWVLAMSHLRFGALGSAFSPWVQVHLQLRTHIEQRRPLTVEAVLPARKGAPAGMLVLCAHGDGDAGGPGANDNASGVAVVLAIARAWTLAIEAGRAGFAADPMERRDMAVPSTPILGLAELN